MLNKRQRIGTWNSMAAVSFLLGACLDILAELYFPNSMFQKIVTFTFASTAVTVILGVVLTFASLAWNDYQESKSARNFVSLGDNDRVISVHKIGDVSVHLPVVGTTQQTILAPSKADIPHVSSGSLHHIHMASKLPEIELMEDDLYNQLFGLGDRNKEKN